MQIVQIRIHSSSKLQFYEHFIKVEASLCDKNSYMTSTLISN